MVIYIYAYLEIGRVGGLRGGFSFKFKWPFKKRWQCPIHNGTLIKLCLIKYELDIKFEGEVRDWTHYRRE